MICILITSTSNTMQYFDRIALKYVETKDDELRHARQKREAEGESEDTSHVTSILESFFESGLEDKDIVGLVNDTLMGGIDTVLHCITLRVSV